MEEWEKELGWNQYISVFSIVSKLNTNIGKMKFSGLSRKLLWKKIFENVTIVGCSYWWELGWNLLDQREFGSNYSEILIEETMNRPLITKSEALRHWKLLTNLFVQDFNGLHAKYQKTFNKIDEKAHQHQFKSRIFVWYYREIWFL